MKTALPNGALLEKVTLLNQASPVNVVSLKTAAPLGSVEKVVPLNWAALTKFASSGVDHAPAGSPTILVSDRLTVAPDHAPVANPNVYLASTDIVRQIAGDVDAVWSDLLAAAARQEPAQILRRHVQEVLTENGCLPTQVLDRLMQDRIRPGE